MNNNDYVDIYDEYGNIVKSIHMQEAKVPMTEIGTYKSSYFEDSQSDPYNPDNLVSIKGLEIFDKMEHDEQVKVSFDLKKRIILSKGWDVIPASEEEEDIKKADFIKFNFEESYEGVFDNSIAEILSAMQYGFSVTEKLYKILEDKDYKGMIGLRTLKTRPPHSIEFFLEDNGDIKKDGLKQWQSEGQVPLPQDKFIIYSYNSKFGNPYGQSDFRDAYRSWYIKDKLIRFEAIYLERHGNPFMLGKYKRGASKDTQDALLNILNRLQTKTSAKVPEDVTIELLEVAKSGEQAFQSSISKHDTKISRAFLLPELLGFTDREGGSYSLGKEQFDLFYMLVESWQKQVEELINEHLIKFLINFNFENVEVYPKIKFKTLTKIDKTKLFEVWLKAIEKGAVIATIEDEKILRETLGFKVRTEEDEILPRPKKETPFESDNPDVQVEPKESEEQELQAKAIEFEANETRKFARAKTEFEKKVSFSKIEDDFEELTRDLATDLGVVVKRIENSLLSDIEEKKIIEKQKYDAVNTLKIKPKQKDSLEKTFGKNFNKIFRRGRETAKSELENVKKMQAGSIGNFTPVQAIDYLKAKAVQVTGVEEQFILKNVQTILTTGMKNGKTENEIVFELEDFFEQYKTVQKLPTGEIERIEEIPGRLNTVARTNISDAYNQGRMATYNSPDVKEFVEALQYSAIIDQNTTDFCRAYDKRIYKANDPIWNTITAPNHFNCRSTIVPILTGEDFKTDKKLAIQQPESFGGTKQ
jgi:SPP1 gp7 family putative phage head morphogenesis protein